MDGSLYIGMFKADTREGLGEYKLPVSDIYIHLQRHLDLKCIFALSMSISSCSQGVLLNHVHFFVLKVRY